MMSLKFIPSPSISHTKWTLLTYPLFHVFTQMVHPTPNTQPHYHQYHHHYIIYNCTRAVTTFFISYLHFVKNHFLNFCIFNFPNFCSHVFYRLPMAWFLSFPWWPYITLLFFWAYHCCNTSYLSSSNCYFCSSYLLVYCQRCILIQAIKLLFTKQID